MAFPTLPWKSASGMTSPYSSRLENFWVPNRETAGDAALNFQVFPGLTVEVILWLADEEFPGPGVLPGPQLP